jgi:hypothetical protein
MHIVKYYQIQRRDWYNWPIEPRWGYFHRVPYSKYEIQDHYSEEDALERAKIKMKKLEKQLKQDERAEYRIVKMTKTILVEPVNLEP